MDRAKVSGFDALERNAVALSLIALGAVWLDRLMAPRWAAWAYGPICSHTASPGVHCPACYAALSLIALGIALAASGLRRRAPAFSGR